MKQTIVKGATADFREHSPDSGCHHVGSLVEGRDTSMPIHYSAGYQPYALFLAIRTAGFPIRHCKQILLSLKSTIPFADQLFKANMIVMSLMEKRDGHRALLHFSAGLGSNDANH